MFIAEVNLEINVVRATQANEKVIENINRYCKKPKGQGTAKNLPDRKLMFRTKGFKASVLIWLVFGSSLTLLAFYTSFSTADVAFYFYDCVCRAILKTYHDSYHGRVDMTIYSILRFLHE